MAGSHFVSFDSSVLSHEKICTRYLPPVKSWDEYEIGNDDTVITLDKLGDMKVFGVFGRVLYGQSCALHLRG